MFKPGDRVRCIDAENSLAILTEGAVYTVAGLRGGIPRQRRHRNHALCPDGLILQGIALPSWAGSFAAARFVLINPRETSIEVFTRMLEGGYR
jgi:hypothetical protein